MAKLSRAQVLKHLGGNPELVGAELDRFSSSAKVLSSDAPRLIATLEGQWVAVHHDSVAATAPEKEGVMKQLATKGISPAEVIVRYIDRHPKTFILYGC